MEMSFQCGTALANLVLETQSPETSVAFFLLYKVWVMRLGGTAPGE